MALERLSSTLGASTGTALESAPTAPGGGETFADAITRVLQEANQEQISASQTAKELLVDGRGTIHDAMIALDKADSSFRLLMEMRNRLIDGVHQLLDTRL
jgi:flagellar hook-basal body complex protein FliE